MSNYELLKTNFTSILWISIWLSIGINPEYIFEFSYSYQNLFNFDFIKLLRIIIPLILTYKTKNIRNKEIGKNIVSVQIILSLLFSVFMILSPFIQSVLSVNFPVFVLPLVSFLCVKLFVVVKNGTSLNTNNKLSICLKNSFLYLI